MALISALFPSRSRPIKAITNLSKWYYCALKESEMIISLDEDDPCLDEYKTLSKGFPCKIIVNKNRSAVDAINEAAKVATGDIFIVVSDDTECTTPTIPDGWDTLLLKEVEGETDWILKTQDGIQPWIITMPVMDRVYYNRFGYIYHPDYLHMFCDTELSCVADLTGRRITSDLVFPHLHYSTGAAVKDAVSDKADATWSQGEKLFIERARKKFDLVNPPGKITSQEYINWARSKGIRL